MVEFNPTTRIQIDSGSFPLNHDCILRINYVRGTGIRMSYLTCRAQDSGSLVLIISSLPVVVSVDVSSVDDLPDYF